MIRRYIPFVMLAAMSMPAMAQGTANIDSRSMTIEGEYRPTVTQAYKIAAEPAPFEPVKQKTAVSYLNDPVSYPFGSSPSLDVLSATSDSLYRNRWWGYASLGYGLRNLADANLDAGFDLTRNSQLRFQGNMGGWNTTTLNDWRSRMRAGDMNASYTFTGKKLNLGVNAGMAGDRHNYMPGSKMTDAISANSNLMEKDRSMHAGAEVEVSINRVNVQAEASVTSTSRKGLSVNGKEVSGSENVIRVNTEASFPFRESALGVQVNYKGVMQDRTAVNGDKYNNTNTVSLVPYWSWYRWRIEARLGMNIDFRMNQYYNFLISPQATAIVRFRDDLNFFTSVTGGNVDYDMYHLNGISPYWTDEKRIEDGYNIIDMCGGIFYHPDTWVSVSLKAGFRNTLNEVFQVRSDSAIVTSLMKQETSNVFYAGFATDMVISNMAQFRGELEYNFYKGKYTGDKMALKPLIDASAYLTVKPVDRLDVTASYRLMYFNVVRNRRMQMVNDLTLRADYLLNFQAVPKCLRTMSAFVEGEHLLGSDFYYWAGYPCIKPGFMLGVSYRF